MFLTTIKAELKQKLCHLLKGLPTQRAKCASLNCNEVEELIGSTGNASDDSDRKSEPLGVDNEHIVSIRKLHNENDVEDI